MTMTTSQARDDFAEVVNRVAYKGERVVICRRGRELAALISIEDLRLLERLSEAEEERLDLLHAQRALEDPAPAVPWGQARRELGL